MRGTAVGSAVTVRFDVVAEAADHEEPDRRPGPMPVADHVIAVEVQAQQLPVVTDADGDKVLSSGDARV